MARRALDQRLKAVWYYAPLAAKHCDENIEYVHQLRVATRRARAALHIFSDILPDRRMRWMKKRLRRLRRAAGSARDLDVLGERLRKTVDDKKFSHLGDVIEQIDASRRKVQKPLIASYRKAKRDGFKTRARALARSVRWRRDEQEPTFSDASRMMLAPLVDEFFTAAAADLSDIKKMHRMRIAGKRVRYAMELLAGAFHEAFRGELYETVTEVQESLGTINDHATAVATFHEWLTRAGDSHSRDELAQLVADEQMQLDQKHREFLGWWTTECAAELARQFASFLSPRCTLV